MVRDRRNATGEWRFWCGGLVSDWCVTRDDTRAWLLRRRRTRRARWLRPSCRRLEPQRSSVGSCGRRGLWEVFPCTPTSAPGRTRLGRHAPSPGACRQQPQRAQHNAWRARGDTAMICSSLRALCVRATTKLRNATDAVRSRSRPATCAFDRRVDGAGLDKATSRSRAADARRWRELGPPNPGCRAMFP
jgi:hypothetical protein